MFTIKVDKECGCFKKSDFENNTTESTKDNALLKAQYMVNYMNDEFCQKHSFTLREEGDTFKISMDAKEEAHSGCCGGGHCS
jgi:hypothetical protein